MFVECLMKKLFQSCSTRTGFMSMHDSFVALRVVNDLLGKVFVCQVPVHCIDQQHNFKPARTHHLGLKAHNFESPKFTFESFSLKAVYNSCKLQRLFTYSFTHTKHQPTEIVIFINVCYQMKSFSGDSFPFSGAGFVNILPNFLISYEV